jgi:DNA-binding GntR family transcriptional regulator
MSIANEKKSESRSSLKQGSKILQSTKPSLALQVPDIANESHKSARDRIRGTLLRRISEGVYLPGERLKEMTLAREFEVSQAPVREAFRELETLGVLISEHYRGTRVREISKQETEDVYQLRGYLEEIAAQLISPAKLKNEIESIEAMQAAMQAAALAGDMDSFARINTQFHRSIVGMASNQVLLKVWDSFEIGMRSRMNIQRNEDRLLLLADVHQPIVDSLKLGDLKQTGVMLREHAFSILKILP